MEAEFLCDDDFSFSGVTVLFLERGEVFELWFEDEILLPVPESAVETWFVDVLSFSGVMLSDDFVSVCGRIESPSTLPPSTEEKRTVGVSGSVSLFCLTASVTMGLSSFSRSVSSTKASSSLRFVSFLRLLIEVRKETKEDLGDGALAFSHEIGTGKGATGSGR